MASMGLSMQQVIPLSSIATFRTGVEPRSLNRFQQLNAVKISGVAPRARSVERGGRPVAPVRQLGRDVGGRLDEPGVVAGLLQESLHVAPERSDPFGTLRAVRAVLHVGV